MPAPPPDITHRPGTPDDLPALFELLRTALPGRAFSPELLAEKLWRRPWPDAACMRVHAAWSGSGLVGMLQSIVRPAVARAWIGLFAVDPSCRRRGIASALLDLARNDWTTDIDEVHVLGVPGNYFAPGVDAGLLGAHALLLRFGFENTRDCANLIVDLDRPFEQDRELDRLKQGGLEIRRAVQRDAASLEVFFASHFGADWGIEAGLALRNEPPTLHLALRDGKVIAFAAHSTQNREWGFFGPMGTTPEARGCGVGRVLLRCCLNDLLAAGFRRALIPWVGPVDFYVRAANARVDQTFRRYRLCLRATGKVGEGPA